MFTRRQLEKYADVLLWGLRTARKHPFESGDIVAVRYNLAAVSLAEQLQARLLDAGMHPLLRQMGTPAMEHSFYTRANREQLVFEPPGERTLYRSLHGSIYLNAPDSLTHLQQVQAERIALSTRARKPLRDILNRREERGEFGWTLCSYTTAALARHARMTPKDYSRQIVRACYLDRPDPVAAWEDIYRQAEEIKQWLTSLPVAWYRIESTSMDLRIEPGERRRWAGVSGHNIPSFELFVSPDWRGTRGVYYADQPSYRHGNVVRGVRLEFRDGEVSNHDARRGGAFLASQLEIDAGARRLGEFSLTDRRFSRIDRFMADTLFDENYGGQYGNCHIALGSSYTDTFAGNPARLTTAIKRRLGFNDSALHWDLVNTEEKTVTAHLKDGTETVIYEKGRFTC